MKPLSIQVSMRDVRDRRARIHFSTDAKVKLCEMAGAPWNDANPAARVSDLQREVLSRKERMKIVHGGSGLGKTTTIAMEAIVHAMIPYEECVIAGSRYDHVSSEFRAIARGLRRLFEGRMSAFSRFSVKSQQNYHDYDVRTLWGSTMIGLSTDSDEGASFLGKQFHWVGLSEGSHISATILDTRILRALDRAIPQRDDGVLIETGYLANYTTPKGYEGCSAAEWERVMRATQGKPEKMHYGKVPFEKTIWLREAAATENPSYSRAAFEARRETLDKHAFEETYLGRMTFKTGMIFKEFSDEKHIRPMPKPDVIRQMRLGIGMDTGAYFGAVLAGLYEPAPGFIQRWRLGTVYTAQCTITESLSQVREMVCRVLGPVFGVHDFDALKDTGTGGAIDVWAVDPASQHKLEIMDDIGVGLTGWELSLLDSLDRMREWLRRGESMFADGEVDDLLDQMRKYIWKQRKAPSVNGTRVPVIYEPRAEYDHLIDADRGIQHVLADMGPMPKSANPLTAKEWFEKEQRQALFGPLREAMKRAEARGGVFS